jgi:uncharacterized integral membrane protein
MAVPSGRVLRRPPTGNAGSVVSSEEGAENKAANREDRGGRQLGAGAIASLTGVGVLLIFIIQNTEDVRFDFLVFSFTWPLWLYTIVTALFGALVWLGVGVIRRHRRRKARREDRRD